MATCYGAALIGIQMDGKWLNSVRVFGPLSPTNILPSLRTLIHSSLQRNQGLPLSPLEYTLSMCICLCVFVCSRSATQRTFSSDNRKWCATSLILISQFVLFTKKIAYFLLGCYFTLPLSFFTIYNNCFGLLPLLSGNLEFVISAYDFATPNLTLPPVLMWNYILHLSL